MSVMLLLRNNKLKIGAKNYTPYDIEELWNKYGLVQGNHNVFQSDYHKLNVNNGAVDFKSQWDTIDGGKEWSYDRPKENRKLIPDNSPARKESANAMWGAYQQFADDPSNAGFLYNMPAGGDPVRSKMYERGGYVSVNPLFQIKDNRMQLPFQDQQVLAVADQLLLSPSDNHILRKSRSRAPQDTTAWNTPVLDSIRDAIYLGNTSLDELLFSA